MRYFSYGTCYDIIWKFVRLTLAIFASSTRNVNFRGCVSIGERNRKMTTVKERAVRRALTVVIFLFLAPIETHTKGFYITSARCERSFLRTLVQPGHWSVQFPRMIYTVFTVWIFRFKYKNLVLFVKCQYIMFI